MSAGQFSLGIALIVVVLPFVLFVVAWAVLGIFSFIRKCYKCAGGRSSVADIKHGEAQNLEL
jgi:hypothetical protein